MSPELKVGNNGWRRVPEAVESGGGIMRFANTVTEEGNELVLPLQGIKRG